MDKGVQSAACLNTLGSGLHERYEPTSGLEDLQEATDIAKQAIEASEPGDKDRGLYTVPDNLGIRLGERFLKSEDTDQIEESVHFLRQAVEVTPEDD